MIFVIEINCLGTPIKNNVFFRVFRQKLPKRPCHFVIFSPWFVILRRSPEIFSRIPAVWRYSRVRNPRDENAEKMEATKNLVKLARDRKHEFSPQKVAFCKGNPPKFQGNLGW